MWVQFAPSADVADAASWQMYKLGRPISPLEVVLNGSQSMHAVSDEGISVRGVGSGNWEQLNIRSAVFFFLVKLLISFHQVLFRA